MRINVVLNLLKKEFLNIIRDKKSFIFMILLPILAFPLMIGLFMLVFTSIAEVQDSNIKYGVNYEINEEFKTFTEEYSEDYSFEVVYKSKEELEKDFYNGDLDIYIIKDNNNYELHYDENATSGYAESILVQNLYEDYQKKYVTDRLTEKGIDLSQLENEFNVVFVQENVTSTGTLIPAMLSMILTMLIASTAFGVAIEITTSEKEKGTLETILSLPVRKSELIASKYLTTAAMSTMSGILTYISLFTSLYFGKSTLEMLGFISLDLRPRILIIYFVAIVLFSIFLSGLVMSMAIFSKSLKEAQNTLTPVQTLIALVSYLPMFGIEATTTNAIIPFANIALLFNNALSSNLETSFIILTFLSTLVYSMLMIIIVSKLYNEEDILFNSSNLKYMSFTSGKGKTICFSVFTSILLLVIIYLISMYLSLLFVTSSNYVLILIMPLTTLAIIIISGLITKLDFKKALNINKFSIKKFFYLILFFIGIRILSDNILTVVANLFPSLVEDSSVIVETLDFNNFYMGLLIVGIIAPITEELLFRGILFNSINKKYNYIIAIIVSSLLFGIYHMNWLQGINAFLLGIVLAYSLYKSKSIFVPILLHIFNNTYALLLSEFPILNIDVPLYGTIVLVIFAVILILSSIYINEKELK